ncbi:hypothetical protein BJP25_01030 [Actinokineospora bangkokensis]|uniref:Uncharacterized protein n=1 Tax=Actinokineospora bangkokensis TaxID=1193682 RepID=A0A1Q9LHG6_9PSEU|nr:hypothetical protein BJP25_01030 [Actinokineospora bangkokensis]
MAVLAARLTEAAAVLAGGDRRAVPACVRDVTARGPAAAGAAAMMALVHALDLLWSRGWLPADVVAVAPRPVRGLLLDAIAEESTRHAAAALHPTWRAQLAELEVAGREPGEFGPTELGLAVELLAALMTLPQLPHLVPRPGTAVAHERSAGVDRRVLARVRALLAKAESTPYPDEAEALSAKAQELMARHAFEQAVVDATAPPPEASARRLWLTAPYQGPKAALVDAVAGANRCRSVFYATLGCVAVVGHDTDLEIVSVLAQSLQRQATTALARSQGRTRSYRHAFLTGYAHRIQTRLTTATTDATSGDTRLVPLLTARQHAVDIKFAAMFPHLHTRRPTISNPTGWTDGTHAATHADLLPPHPRVAG